MTIHCHIRPTWGREHLLFAYDLFVYDHRASTFYPPLVAETKHVPENFQFFCKRTRV